MVGREGELHILLTMLDDVLFGEGKRIAAITGEGGVGKSRLIAEWQVQANKVIESSQPISWLSGQGRSYGQRTHGIFVDKSTGWVYVADTANNRIQVFKPAS